MSRFGWAFVNDVIIGTGSAGTGSAVDGLANSVVVRSGGIVSGATNFIFNNSTGFGQLTGSLGITNNLSVTGSLTSGPFTSTTVNATTNINSPSITGSLRSNTGNKFGSSAGDVHQFTGSISAGVVSGTTGQFTTISGSIITGSTLLYNNATINSANITTINTTTNTSNVLYVTGASNSIISGKDITSLANRETSGLVNGATTPSIANSTTFYIKPDGSKLYVHDTTDSEIVICTLSTPWDISTLTIDSTLITNKPIASAVATGFTFKPDGRNAYILTSGPTNQELFQANLSIPWDLNASTAWTSVKILTGSGGSITGQQGISISEDGRYLFTCSGSTSASSILRYTMSTPWDASTISHTSPVSSNVTLQNGVKDISVSNDGKSILILDNSNYLHDFELSTPYDLTSVTKKSSISLDPITAPHAVVNAMFLKPDQTKIYFDSVNTTKHFISLTMSSSQVDLVGGIHITGDAKITQNINVYGDATFEDLSGSNAQFRTLSGSLVNLTTLTASNVLVNQNATIAGNLTVNGSLVLGDANSDIATVVSQITASTGVSGSQGQFAQLTASSAIINGGAIDNTVIGGVGAVNGKFTNLTASTHLSASQIFLGTGGMTVSSNIVPNVSNAYDLGSVSNKWRNVFVSGAINTDSIAAGLLRSTGSDAYIVIGTGSTNTFIEVAHTGGNVYRGMRIISGTLEKWFAGADNSDNLYVIRRNASTNDLTINNTGTVSISTVDINGGTIDGTTIATSDITVGAGKTLNVSAGTFTTAAGQITNNQLANISGSGKVTNAATTATSANTPNAIVLRDASGNFAAANANFLTARISEINISGNYLYTDTPDINSYTYNLSGTSVSANDSVLNGIHLTNDGTILYAMGDTNNKFLSYPLQTAWDVSLPITFASSSSPALTSKSYSGLSVSPNGFNYYTFNATDKILQQYTSSQRDSVSSIDVTPKNTFSLEAGLGTIVGLYFKPDGSKLIYSDYTTGRVYQRNLSTAWDISTLDATSTSSSIGATQLKGAVTTSDGRKLYVLLDSSFDNVKEYSLSTPWDITTLTATGLTLSVALQTSVPNQIFISSDNKYIFVSDTAEKIYRYSTSDIKTIDLNANTTIAGQLNVNYVNINEGVSISDKISISTKPKYKTTPSIDGTFSSYYENVISFNNNNSNDISGLIFDNNIDSLSFNGFVGAEGGEVKLEKYDTTGTRTSVVLLKSEGIVIDARSSTSESITFTGSIYNGVRKVAHNTLPTSLATEDYFIVISGSTAFNFGVPDASLHTGRQIIFRNETGVACSLSASSGTSIFKTGTGGAGAINTVGFSGSAGQTSVTFISDGLFWQKISGT